MNITGFASRDTGFSLTSESRSVLVEVRLLRKRGDVGLVIFEVIFLRTRSLVSGRILESVQALGRERR
jgi:hypothetical protein